MRKAASKIISFNYATLPSEAVKILKKGYDFELDGKDNTWKLYLHYDNSFKGFDRSLLNYAQHILGFENTLKGEGYLDMYIKVQEEPTDALFLINDSGIWRNIRYQEVKDGLYQFKDLKTEKEVIENLV